MRKINYNLMKQKIELMYPNKMDAYVKILGIASDLSLLENVDYKNIIYVLETDNLNSIFDDLLDHLLNDYDFIRFICDDLSINIDEIEENEENIDVVNVEEDDYEEDDYEEDIVK